MLLEEIRLFDFRCFYGETGFKFSTDAERNVTLISAENGVGKTTLLNALKWCFYGKTTTKFENPNDIVNYDAKLEGDERQELRLSFRMTARTTSRNEISRVVGMLGQLQAQG